MCSEGNFIGVKARTTGWSIVISPLGDGKNVSMAVSDRLHDSVGADGIIQTVRAKKTPLSNVFRRVLVKLIQGVVNFNGYNNFVQNIKQNLFFKNLKLTVKCEEFKIIFGS